MTHKIIADEGLSRLLKHYNWNIDKIASMSFVQDDNWEVIGVTDKYIHLYNDTTKGRHTVAESFDLDGWWYYGRVSKEWLPEEDL